MIERWDDVSPGTMGTVTPDFRSMERPSGRCMYLGSWVGHSGGGAARIMRVILCKEVRSVLYFHHVDSIAWDEEEP